MNADTSSGNPTGKRASLPGCALSVFHLLRLFWLTGLALLLLGLFGLRAGWTTQRQWSDGLFIAAIAQMLIAGIMIQVPSGETYDAAWMRFVDHGNMTEARSLLVIESMRKMRFSLRAFFGGVFTLLIAGLVLLV